ncbi:MAG: hypothetical protein ACFE9L_12835 [Candidatus Hodarchaeota archaeon]
MSEKKDQEKLVDPKDILFSMPTIEDALPGIVESSTSDVAVLEIHEDDWRQLEFISRDQLENITKEMEQIQQIFDNEAVEIKIEVEAVPLLAFKEIHLRQLIPRPISNPFTFNKLSEYFNADMTRGTLKFHDYSGVVKNAFYIKIEGLEYYGQTDDDKIVVFCLYNADSREDLKNSIMKLTNLLNSEDLLLVDWMRRRVISNKEELEKYFQI